MNFTKTSTTNSIIELRSKLYLGLAAPIDGMWEQLYIGSSQHYLIEDNSHTLGYCCINDQGCLLQVFLLEEYLSQMDQTIANLIGSKLVSSASLSSNEPIAFNACLHHQKSIETNTFCFQHSNNLISVASSLALELVSSDDIPAVKVFFKEQVGMDDTFGYTENLVARKELFMVMESDVIVATSECRMSDSQPNVADLGIIVNRSHQGRGIGTELMQLQVNRALKAGRMPICSTTLENIASRKMIEKSGFYCSNIIFDMRFSDE